MSEQIISEFTKATVQEVISLGTQIVISQRRWLIKRRKIRAKVSFIILIQFYENQEYDKVFRILNDLLARYRVKEEQQTWLVCNGSNRSHYNLSIVERQDYAALQEELEDPFEKDLEMFPEKAVHRTIYATSARLFIWPELQSLNVTPRDLGNIISQWYGFYRRLDKDITEFVKLGELGATRTRFFVIMRFEEGLPSLKQDKIHDVANVIFQDSRIEFSIDDSSTIETIVKWLAE